MTSTKITELTQCSGRSADDAVQMVRSLGRAVRLSFPINLVPTIVATKHADALRAAELARVAIGELLESLSRSGLKQTDLENL